LITKVFQRFFDLKSRNIMKTKIFGILAIVIALGASAFTAPKKVHSQTEYKWFLITDGVPLNNAVPQADASYIDESTTAPSESGCSGTGNQCVSGFLPSQVNSDNQLINNDQTPAEQPTPQM
jgi:hypothetical protein